MNNDIAVAQSWNRLSNGLIAIALQRGLFRSREEAVSVLMDIDLVEGYMKAHLKPEVEKPELKKVPNEG